MAGVVTKNPYKEKNQQRTLHLDPQRLGQNQYNKEMVVNNCINISKYTFSGTYLFQIEGRER